MKFNTNNAWFYAAIANALLAESLPALAVMGENRQLIYIESTMQSLDIQGNSLTFTGNVLVKKGTIEMKAEKVVVTRPQGLKRQELIEAFGSPVIFYQAQDNGKPVKGRAHEVRYELRQDKVILTGSAYMEQLDSNVKGDHITYFVKQQQIKAMSDKGGQVTTVLMPSQLQEKNGKAAAQSFQKEKP
ncbi:MAG: lipopolysaccharide ABC transporter substrate-binding protein LptA [Candidatus Malihini olakiniferum]